VVTDRNEERKVERQAGDARDGAIKAQRELARQGDARVRRTWIRSLATYVPPRLLTNDDLEKMVDTTSEWILQRTGIHTRHIVDPGVATSDLGKEAALKAIEQAGLTPSDIDVIIVGTTTPDMFFPSTACLIQHKIGADRAWGFDLAGACSGFNFALAAGSQLVATGFHNHALVVGADVMSSIIDYTDRATCVLFGDGAGAAVVSVAPEGEAGIIDFAHEIDGSGGPALQMPAGGSLRPSSHETVEKKLHYVKQDGQTVFKFAVRKTEEISRRVLERNGYTPEDVDLFVSHQANRRIITSAADKLGLDPCKVIVNIERYGNTTAATIPLALDEARDTGRLKKGDLVLLASVGAGFTIGSVLLRWGLRKDQGIGA
jgi:3-oxoacyl-[acyl-carrier-protein] synthase-3